MNRLNYIYYKRKSHYLLQYKPSDATKYHFFMSCKLIKIYPHSDTRHCYKSKTYFLPGDIFLPFFLLEIVTLLKISICHLLRMHCTVFDKDPVKVTIIYFYTPSVCSTTGINRLYDRHILLSTQYLLRNVLNCIDMKTVTPNIMK